jgi:hypothetical protein
MGSSTKKDLQKDTYKKGPFIVRVRRGGLLASLLKISLL